MTLAADLISRRNRVEQVTPTSGRLIAESGELVNLADTMRRMDDIFDSFGGLRVTSYQPVFSAQPLEVSLITDRVFTTGTATVGLVGREYQLSSGVGESCRLETGQRGRYQSGVTGVPGVGLRSGLAPAADTTYRWGYFDVNDGFGFEEVQGGMRTFVRHDAAIVHTRDRADWIDPLDGTGPSGLSIDIMDGHIYRLPFSWYGYGTLTIGVIVSDAPGNGDRLIIIDRYKPEGTVSIRTPNLPISVEIEGPGELYVGGRQFGVFGELKLTERMTGDIRTGQTVTGTATPLISARVRDVEPWRDVPLQFSGVDLINDQDLQLYLVLGGTLDNDTDPNWAISQYSQGDTSAEYNLTSTTITGGEIIGGPWLQSASGTGPSPVSDRSIQSLAMDIPIGLPVTLVALSLTGTNASVTTTMRMAELR